MRKIHAKGILRTIAYDITIALDNNVNPKDVVANTKKRLERLKDTNYYKIDWT